MFAKARKTAHPIIQKAIDVKYTNKNYEARLKILHYLLKSGANVNVCAPWGLSVFANVLHLNHCLDTTSAKYELYLFTLTTALEIVRNYDIDVNSSPNNTYSNLDNAYSLYQKIH